MPPTYSRPRPAGKRSGENLKFLHVLHSIKASRGGVCLVKVTSPSNEEYSTPPVIGTVRRIRGQGRVKVRRIRGQGRVKTASYKLIYGNVL